VTYSVPKNPVVLPPGRARLSHAAADRIGAPANTIGTLRLACCNARTIVPLDELV
jgi:hypothetical protein